MDVTLGMPTLIELQSIDETVRLCQDLGLSFIELNMNLPDYCPDKLGPLDLRRISDETGIGFTVHLPEEIDLASFHPSILAGHTETCKEAFRWASKAGASLVNLHLNPGVYFTLPDRRVWVYGQYKDQFLANLLSSFARLLGLADDLGMKVCVENMYNFHIPFIAEAVETLCNLDGFLLTWDVGHDAKTGFREKETLLRHESRIAHLHLHDYDGHSDHRVLFTGIVDVPGMLTFARDRGIKVVIETKTVDALVESVQKVRAL